MYLYDLSVTFYGDPLGMNYLPWYFGMSIMMQAIVGAIVQVSRLSDLFHGRFGPQQCHRRSSRTACNS
jgi:hypothetical protein